jgi:hypothetical protein
MNPMSELPIFKYIINNNNNNNNNNNFGLQKTRPCIVQKFELNVTLP